MATSEMPKGRTELEELVTAAQAGDRSAFDEVVRRTYVDTFTLALRLTANEEDAQDVVQEAYLRAWKAIGRFRGDAQFSTWMYRITANAAFTAVKRRRRTHSDRLDLLDDLVDPHAENQPEDAAEAAALVGRLSVALEQLPAKLRALVVLKDVYGLSHEEIAEELGISVAAAKVRLHRGRKKLRDLLYDDEGKWAHAV